MSPRGNDAEAALHELADKFGKGVGNAEELIEASIAAVPRELRKAELLPRNEEATAEVRKRLDKLKGPDGAEVVSAAVRGEYTTIVYVDKTGRHQLGVLDADEKVVPPLPRPPTTSKNKPPTSRERA